MIDYPTKRILPTRPGAPVAIILHGTGETDLGKLLKFYTAVDGLCPHYFISTDGDVYGIVGEDKIAYHCKMEAVEARLYRQGWNVWSEWTWNNGAPKHMGQEWTGYRSWREVWISRGIVSPLELITKERPNARSIGIELQSPTDAIRAKDIYTNEQYVALAELLKDISKRQRIAISRSTVLGHQDITPLRRCTNRGGYDPGDAMNWNRLWDLTK